MKKPERIFLSNGTSADADRVVAVSLSEDTFRVFLKGEAGVTLCSVRHETLEDALEEIKKVNQQMGWGN